VLLRYPDATRPWQHVLDPLMGYLQLAQGLLSDPERHAEAWNFGPDNSGLATVGAVVARLAELWPGQARWAISAEAQPHEAGLLALDSSKARQCLGWVPNWSLETALKHTLDWQLAWQEGRNMNVVTREQIAVHQGET
jgi:CDP-glucose 4,6-dehydratase